MDNLKRVTASTVSGTKADWKRHQISNTVFYTNSKAGEVISRRQFDVAYGNLKKGGFKSYEQARKAAIKANPEKAAIAPARGRVSRDVSLGTLRTAGPADGRGSRRFDAGIDAEQYNATLRNLLRNPKIHNGISGIRYTRGFVKWVPNIHGQSGMTYLDELLPGFEIELIRDDAPEEGQNNSDDLENFDQFVIQVGYKQEFSKRKAVGVHEYKKIPKSKHKKPGRKPKKAKAKKAVGRPPKKNNKSLRSKRK